jgi:WD40 repeat protein/tRNA A-37 threonylcarbamoyl transferase component Bud32
MPNASSEVAGYEILSELGRGGMGVVFRARHHRLHRVVALKMILSARFACPEELLRFRLEGETAASLQHPNIVQVYEVGSHQGQPYMVLEYVEGGTLADALEDRALPIPQAAHLVEVLARAVQVAHNHGIVHRDLKPANILLQVDPAEMPDGSAGFLVTLNDSTYIPKITDFGLAKHLPAESAASVSELRLSALAAVGGLTETGRILGTPGYMAPEQAAARAGQIGPHTDVYALGAILYECLTGKPPFQSSDAVATFLQVVSHDPVPLRRIQPRLPRDLETICARCLEKDPARRYAGANELADDLRRFLDGRPIRARRIGPLERTWKWARRRPVIAGLLACLLLVTVLGFTGVTGALLYALEGWREAAEQQRRAEEESEIARRESAAALAAQAKEAQERKNADRARIQAETNLTFSRLAHAGQMWQLNKLEGSAAKLDLIDPKHRGWVWRHLDGLHRSELRVLSPPGAVVVSGLAFSPDGVQLAVAGGNPYVRNSNGRCPAQVTLWETSTGRRMRTLPGFRQITGRVAWSPDHQFLAACGRDGTIRVWSARTGRLFRVLGAQPHLPNEIAFSPDSRRLACAGTMRSLLIYDVQTGNKARHPGVGGRAGNRVAWSPDGRFLASGGTEVRVWNLAGAEVLFVKKGDSIAFSPDSRTLAVVVSSVVRLYPVPDARPQRMPEPLVTYTGHTGGVAGLAFSPDGQLLATGGADSTVRIWNVEDGRELSVWRGHRGRVESVCFHPAGWMVASGSAQPGDVRLWDLTRTQQHLILPDGKGWIDALAFSASGREVLTQRQYGLVEVRDTVSGLQKLVYQLPIHSAWHTPGAMGTFSGDAGTLVATACEASNHARAWDVRTGKPLPGSYRHDPRLSIWHVSLSHEGSVAASSAREGNGAFTCEHAVWEPRTGKVRWRFEQSSVHVGALLLSPDGRTLARAVTDLAAEALPDGQFRMRPGTSRIELWRVPALGGARPTAPWLTLAGDSIVRSLAFRGDGKVLAACGYDAHVTLWELPSGRRLHSRPLQGQGSLEGLAFSPDGRLLAGASRTDVFVWDVEEGQEVLALGGSPPRSGDGGFSPRIAWSADGKRLAATNWTHRVSVWEGIDLSRRKAKQELRAAAHARLPRWHLENAAAASRKGQWTVFDFHFRQVARLGPLAPSWRLIRGDLVANLGQWEEAAADHALALEGGSGHEAHIWQQHMLLQARIGKPDLCRKLAPAILERFAQESAPRPLGQAILACSVVPGALADPNRLVRLAKNPPRPHPKAVDAPWAHHVVATACLRAGRYGEAIGASEASEAALVEDNQWARNRVLNWLILALAHHHQGNKAHARRWFGQAQGWFATEKKMAGKRVIPAGIDWTTWLWMLQLRDEMAIALEK